MNDSATLVQRGIWALIIRTRGGRGSPGLITNGALSVPPPSPLWINVVWRGPIKTLWAQTFKEREREREKRGNPLIRVRVGGGDSLCQPVSVSPVSPTACSSRTDVVLTSTRGLQVQEKMRLEAFLAQFKKQKIFLNQPSLRTSKQRFDANIALQIISKALGAEPVVFITDVNICVCSQ